MKNSLFKQQLSRHINMKIKENAGQNLRVYPLTSLINFFNTKKAFTDLKTIVSFSL